MLTGQNKLRFKTMWKGKGKLNMEVVLAQTFTPKNEVRPNSNESMQGHIPLDSDSGPSNQLTQQDGTDLPAQGSETNNSVSNESIPQNDDKNPKPKVSVYKGDWIREEVKADKDRIYVFVDNIEDSKTKYEPTATQAVIRGLDNARGIITKRDRKKNKNSYFNDKQFLQFKEDLESTIRYLKLKSLEGKEIVFPNNGLGTGKAKLAVKAPKIFDYLNQRLLEEFGFDNVKGELVNDIITNQNKGDDNRLTRL